MTSETEIFLEREALLKVLSAAARYRPYQKVYKSKINPETRVVDLFCISHGKGSFRRIGDTNIWRCRHSDHLGGSSMGRDNLRDPDDSRRADI